MTIDETIQWFNAIYEANQDEMFQKNDFVCGIESEESLKGGVVSQGRLLGWTLCDTPETAITLLNRMRDEGFPVVNETGNEKAVYICRKEQRTSSNIETPTIQ